MDLDVKLFLSKIEVRPVIWNKKLPGYSNRNVTDRAWKEISKEMEVEETILRNKWKYLRYQFCLELGNSTKARSGNSDVVEPTIRWKHFKALMFLKDVVRPRTRNNKRKQAPTSEEEDSSLEDEDKETQWTDASAEISASSSVHDPSTFKWSTSNTKYNQKDVEPKKAQERISLDSKGDEDEDMLFFRSLMPFIKRIPDHLKLQFRSSIQTVLQQFVYGTEKDVEIFDGNE
ncbi:hypothetical protein JTE90_006392 [Oedothorax gibbosus]|uniref:MADF domain-containing protein n=1 Tax=Oedothorax gibbosus TaxID=931172 RepID=A0AAV6VXJ6_9ARAC|nr:hypothetical protein JTE90_006392 [Oedothorax gibbosus]